jgi:hypothetical protein
VPCVLTGFKQSATLKQARPLRLDDLCSVCTPCADMHIHAPDSLHNIPDFLVALS